MFVKKSQDEQPYQIYSLNPIPDKHRHVIRFNLSRKSFGSIAVGLITEDKKQLRFIK